MSSLKGRRFLLRILPSALEGIRFFPNNILLWFLEFQ